MADKATFTPDEWRTVMESVMATGMAVSAAEPSGLWGMLKEGFASASAMNEANQDQHANPLIRAVVADFATSEGRKAVQDDLRDRLKGAKSSDIKDRSITLLREASSIVDAKAPEDSAAFKAWLQQIGQRVADAANEGGFLGFGGVQVTDAEKATLDDISKALEKTTA